MLGSGKKRGSAPIPAADDTEEICSVNVVDMQIPPNLGEPSDSDRQAIRIAREARCVDGAG